MWCSHLFHPFPHMAMGAAPPPTQGFPDSSKHLRGISAIPVLLLRPYHGHPASHDIRHHKMLQSPAKRGRQLVVATVGHTQFHNMLPSMFHASSTLLFQPLPQLVVHMCAAIKPKGIQQGHIRLHSCHAFITGGGLSIFHAMIGSDHPHPFKNGRPVHSQLHIVHIIHFPMFFSSLTILLSFLAADWAAPLHFSHHVSCKPGDSPRLAHILARQLPWQNSATKLRHSASAHW